MMKINYAIIDETGAIYEVGAADETRIPARVPDGYGWLRHDGSVVDGSLPISPKEIDQSRIYSLSGDELIAIPIAPQSVSIPDPVEQAILYLTSTDWMLMRYLETGKEVPPEVTERRAEAREIANGGVRTE